MQKNENRPGYKKTKVGWIPAGWDASTVGGIVDKGIIAKPLDGNYGNIHPVANDFVDTGIPFVMAKDVQRGIVNIAGCTCITREQADSLQKGFAKEGDVLLTHKATVGNTAIIEKISTDYIMLTPQVTYYRVLDKGHMNNKYLRHYFDCGPFQKVLSVLAGGGTRSYIGITAQRNLPINYPPVPEQEAIAGVLECWDKGIRNLELKIGNKRRTKKGLMQRLLSGKTRLPGFSNDWKTVKFGQITTPRKERIDPRRDGVQEFCIELEHIESSTGKILGNTSANEKASLKTVFQEGDILFGKLRAYLRKYWFANRSGVCSTEIWVFAPNTTQITANYLFQIIKTEPFIDATSSTSGTHMPRSDWSAVKNYELPLPPLEEQQAIAEVLSAADGEIEVLERKLGLWRDQKKYLLQNLVTGTIRLPAFVKE